MVVVVVVVVCLCSIGYVVSDGFVGDVFMKYMI